VCGEEVTNVKILLTLLSLAAAMLLFQYETAPPTNHDQGVTVQLETSACMPIVASTNAVVDETTNSGHNATMDGMRLGRYVNREVLAIRRGKHTAAYAVMHAYLMSGSIAAASTYVKKSAKRANEPEPLGRL
jgi:hypothetical protein